MKDFIAIACNRSAESLVRHGAFRDYLQTNRMPYACGEIACGLFDRAWCYQLHDREVPGGEPAPRIGVSGSVYGLLSRGNESRLTYAEVQRLLDRERFLDGWVRLEGNAVLCAAGGSRIAVQSDLEGYRRVFYHLDGDLFAATSRLPLLLKLVGKPWELDPFGATAYFCGREAKFPYSIVRQIRVLPAMSRAVLTRNGLDVQSVAWADLYEPRRISPDACMREVREAYRRAIDRDTRSAATNAVTLSGGFDSNALTKLCMEIDRNRFTAVSLGYRASRFKEANVYDETVYAERMAKKNGYPFVRYVLTADEFFAGVGDFIRSIDQPGHDPSSFFAMNRAIQRDGFTHLVNGMGGDANYAPKGRARLVAKLFLLDKAFGHPRCFKAVRTRLGHRGLLRHFRNMDQFDWRPKTLYSFLDGNNVMGAAVPFARGDLLRNPHFDNDERRAFFADLFRKARTAHEASYAVALLNNPDEYHAYLSSVRTGLGMSMPYVNTPAALTLMNAANYFDVESRDFQLRVFPGIDRGLLFKGKSGLSIPYSEWIPSLAAPTFARYEGNGLLAGSVDVPRLRQAYFGEPAPADALALNVLVWKLHVLAEYVELHRLNH